MCVIVDGQVRVAAAHELATARETLVNALARFTTLHTVRERDGAQRYGFLLSGGNDAPSSRFTSSL